MTRVAHPTDRGGPGEPTARPESPVLSAEGLQRRYGGRLVLDVDRIDVRRSEVLAVLGPNGAGKSTLFRLLLLLERPDAGRIHFEGRAVSPGDRAAMRRMAGVFQRPMLFAGSVESNVALGLRARGVPRRERARRVAEALAWVGLERLAHVPVGTLSGGEAQRVALARALVVEPDVLLLDEPTANLDVTVRRRFREDLERLVRQRAGAVVLITHDPAEAFAIADRVAVIQEGRIVQVGTPTDVVMDPATPFVAAFTGAELLLDARVTGYADELLTVQLPGGVQLHAVAAPGHGFRPGAPVHVAYRPEDIVLSTGEAETSARNRLSLRVASLVPAGSLIRVRLEGGVELAALVTRESAERLGLAPGRPVIAHLKATALRAYPAPER